MTNYSLSLEVGTLEQESDRRFRRLVAWIALSAFIFGVIVPFLDIATVIKDLIEPEDRWVRMLPPPPKPAEQPLTREPDSPKPKLTEQQKLDRSKQRVAKLMRNFDALADLRDKTLPTMPQTLTREIITASVSTASVAADLNRTSGGIGDTQTVDRNASTLLGGYSTEGVESAIGGSGSGMGRGGNGGRRLAVRTLEEIQLIFDRNKGSLYTMYQRALRESSGMAGKVVVRLVIAPSGRVSACTLVSSELNNPAFEQKVIDRVLLMDFGSKNVPEFTVEYPILFLPA